MLTISSQSWYRPYITYVNDVERVVDKIYIYNEEGIVISTHSGWLEKK